MRPKMLNYPPNPDYGRGVCQRRIVIRVEQGLVRGHLADNFHEMRCAVTHDRRTVARIDAEAIRIPTTACPAAIGQLQGFVGTAIDTPGRYFYGDGRARHHCTHLYDLVVIAIRHAARERGTTIYEARVPDETGEPVILSITRNGETVHEWQARDGVILAPGELMGHTLDKGFAGWAREAFNDEAFEAAMILSRTWLIAVGRHYVLASVAGQPATTNPQMFDRCFAYSMPQVETALYTGEAERAALF